MKRFTDFLQEANESHVVMTFGRFNPPHAGHDTVIEKVLQVAEQYNAPYYVFLSRTHDSSKNPLDPETKLAYVRELFPESHAQLADKNHTGIIQLAEKINGSHTHLHVVAGQDRVYEYQTLLDRYNGKNYHYNRITVHSSGDRDPLSENIDGISATKMREYARTGNENAFYMCTANETSIATGARLYYDVRKGLGLEEEKGKAVFLSGGPGSGKDIVLRPLLQFATEVAPSQLLIKQNLLVEKASIVINGAFDKPKELQQAKMFVESFGYDTMMVYVYTSNAESKKRNEARQGNGRVIKESLRNEKWHRANDNISNYHNIFGSDFCVLDNETEENLSFQFPTLMENLTLFYNARLNELFGQGYPVTPDEMNPINKNVDASQWLKANKKKKKTNDGANFKASVDRNNSIPGNGPGREFTIRGPDGSFPMGGLGDPSFREEVDAIQPNFGGTGSTQDEPMVTPGEKVMGQMQATGDSNQKKKRFKDIRRRG